MGNFLGYPATVNIFVMRSIDIWRVEDGRFIEHWDEFNTLDIFPQIGALTPLDGRLQIVDPSSPQHEDYPMPVGKLFAIGLRSRSAS
jgi:hypothetical protein